MTQPLQDWIVDPDDPRAPPASVWEAMTDAQRAAVVASLPSEFPVSEARPPEGDDHVDAFTGVREALRRWFRSQGRDIYIAGNLPIYYPGEKMFSPDVIAVADAKQRQRNSWIVSNEAGKGLDVAIEIIVLGHRKKDVERNLKRYAELKIPEYYVFDRARLTLSAWELDGTRYNRRIAQRGRFNSPTLGLDLSLDGERLRFSIGDAPVPYADELLERVERISFEATQRAEQEAQRAEQEAQRAEQEAQRANRLAARLRELGIDPDEV